MAVQDLWIAQKASQILIAGPKGQQKFADLEMKPQISRYIYPRVKLEVATFVDPLGQNQIHSIFFIDTILILL